MKKENAFIKVFNLDVSLRRAICLRQAVVLARRR